MSDQLSKGSSYLKHGDARGHGHSPGSGTEEAEQEPYSESLLQGKRVEQKEAGGTPSPPPSPELPLPPSLVLNLTVCSSLSSFHLG